MIDKLLDNINSYSLDDQQRKIVLDDSKYLLVTAGAGCGKSLTILGKIRYLVEIKKIKERDIICISFTNESVLSLKNKLLDFNYKIDVFTFHKLALEILNYNNYDYKVCSSDYLEYLLEEFFSTIITDYPNIIKYVFKYFKYNKKNNQKEYIYFHDKNINKVNNLKKIISRFIKLFKTNGYNIDDFIKMDKKLILPRNKYLLRIIINIYFYYTNELDSHGLIDFDDMIIKSKNILINGKIKKYKYIIIDEFQDTSFIRYELVKEIINKTNAKLLVVGDDFQSIYRFSGCNLDLFINFKKYFKESKSLKIERTYRNSQELVLVAGSFIMKNKYQIKKELKSFKSIKRPIKIVYYDKYIINKIIDIEQKNTLIIGRNNNDIKEYLNYSFYYKNKYVYKDYNINYMTVHSSKGLEEDNVIVINVINDDLGFPSKLKDNSILRLVNPSKDKYIFEEERRLFYVALTRTKNNVYLVTKKNKESFFIKELLRNYSKYIEIIKL